MCASKIGRRPGVGEGVGEGVALGDGETTATVALAVGKLTAGCPHAMSNAIAKSNTRAITV
jgi:hypothetical protein